MSGSVYPALMGTSNMEKLGGLFSGKLTSNAMGIRHGFEPVLLVRISLVWARSISPTVAQNKDPRYIIF